MQHNFILSVIVVFSWLVISNSLPKFSRDVAMATKVSMYYINLVKNFKRMHCIFNIFESAGGLGIGDFRCVTKIYRGGYHGN